MTRIDTESELDALPVGSIVKTGEGWAARRLDTSYAQCWDVPETFRRGSCPASRLIEHGPLALLHVPGRDLVQEAKADAWDQGRAAGWADNDREWVESGTKPAEDFQPTSNPYRDEAP